MFKCSLGQDTLYRGATVATNKSLLQTPKNADTINALIVGISNYNEKSLRLKYADKDAILFNQFLQSSNWAKNIRLLTNEQATASSIYRAIKDLVLSADSLKPIFIYFAGHGDRIEESNFLSNAYLLAWDANSNRVYDGTGGTIDFSKLENYIELLTKNKKVQVYLILDACHAGFDVYKEGMIGAYKDFSTNNLKAIKLLGCSSEGLSQEKDNLQHGVFTYYLVKGLSGAADSPLDYLITLDEISKYLTSNVKKETNNQQTPIITFIDSSSIFGKINTEITEKMKNFSSYSGNLTANYKGIENYSIKNQTPDSINEVVNLFNKYENEQRILEDSSSCWSVYLEYIVKSKLPIKEYLKYKLIDYGITMSQLAINEFLKGKAEPKPASYYEKAKNFCDKALLLMDSSDLSYENTKYNSLFLEAYIILRKSNYKNFNKSMSICNNIITKQNNAAYVYLLKAKLHNYFNEFDSSIYYANKAIQIVPTWTYPYNQIGHIYKEISNFDSAYFYYNKALMIDTSFYNSYNNIGNLYYDYRMYEKSEYYYKKAIERASDSINKSIPYSNLGQVYKLRGNLIHANKYYELAAKDSSFYDVYLNMADLYSEKIKKSKDAESLYLKAIKIEPYSAEVYHGYADHLRIYGSDKKDWSKSDSLYNIAISLNPNDPWSYFGKAYLYLYIYKDTLKANQIIDSSRVFNSKKYLYKLNYSRYLYNLGNKDMSFVYFDSLILEYPFAVRSYLNKLDLMLYSVSIDSTILFSKKMLYLFPNHSTVVNKYADLLYMKGELDSAVLYYNKSLKIDSMFTNSLASLAICNIDKFNVKKSILYSKKAIASNPEKYKIKDFIDYAILQSNLIHKFDSVKSFLLPFLELDSNNLNIFSQLVQVQYRTKSYDTFLLKHIDKFIISGRKQNNLSSTLYYLCLISIELDRKDLLLKYYNEYEKITNNKDIYLEVVFNFQLKNINLNKQENLNLKIPDYNLYNDKFNKKLQLILNQ